VRLARRVLSAGVVVLVLLAAGIAVSGLTARAGNADAALVFGNTVDPSGKPSPRLTARLDVARNLFEQKRVRYILVSGGFGKEGFDEAKAMGSYLRARGVPDSALIEDGHGNNTIASCVNARALLGARHASSVDLVTQYFHIPRARLAAERAGLKVSGALAPRFFEARDLYSLAREVVALPVYALRLGRAGTEAHVPG
jgi:vancomycin permeability regulator SanA